MPGGLPSASSRNRITFSQRCSQWISGCLKRRRFHMRSSSVRVGGSTTGVLITNRRHGPSGDTHPTASRSVGFLKGPPTEAALRFLKAQFLELMELRERSREAELSADLQNAPRDRSPAPSKGPPRFMNQFTFARRSRAPAVAHSSGWTGGAVDAVVVADGGAGAAACGATGSLGADGLGTG
jgi:hypothetical protein